MSKRILFVSDLHCGHMVGLTHPDYQLDGSIGKEEKELWKWFYNNTREKYDHVVCCGDAIDGSGRKSGGTELINTDRLVQVDMAEAALKTINTKRRSFVYGTGYHTGDIEDFEKCLAERFKNSAIKSQLFLTAHGTVFDIRHHVGGSVVPHNIPPSLPRDSIINYLWADRGIQPKARITIRGHFHRHLYSGNPQWMGMILPALQGLGSKYGARRCSGIVDFGVVVFTIHKSGNFEWQPLTYSLKAQAAQQVMA